MSVKASREFDPHTMLQAVDESAKAAVEAAKQPIGRIVDQETPRDKGVMERELQPRTARTPTGFKLTVAARRGAKESSGASLAEVIRYVTRGTGLYREGPGPKHRIRAKHPLRRMVLPGGRKVWSVAGQHANPFVDRLEERADPVFEQVAVAGADDAARFAERVAR